jgi:hypothetical protein
MAGWVMIGFGFVRLRYRVSAQVFGCLAHP